MINVFWKQLNALNAGKSRPDVKPLELPCRIAQLILRPLIHATAVQVESLTKTDRDSGGFGSTNQT